MITKLRVALLGLVLVTIGYSMEGQELEVLELRAYILEDDIPQYMPVDCPIVNEQVQDDVTALGILNTVTYELIHFYGTENLAGSEGYQDNNIVDWEIIYGNGSFEVLMKTKALRLGQKLYSFMEAQQSQSCLDWSLVISNEEILVLNENNTNQNTEVETYDFNRTYERYDPYAEEYSVPTIRTNNYEESIIYDPVMTPEEASESTPSAIIYDPTRQNEILEEQPIATTTTQQYNFSAMMPNPSDQLNLPTDFFKSLQSLGDVERVISNALSQKGYTNKGYFEFDNGFMIATQLEHFNSNGTSKRGQYRYPSRVTFNQSLSFQNYLNTLYLPESGKFRMFVFYVEGVPQQTYEDFNEIDYSLSNNSQVKDSRVDRISSQLINKPYRHKNSYDSNITVMVYECQTRANERRPTLLEVSSISAKDHLTRSGLWESFNQL